MIWALWLKGNFTWTRGCSHTPESGGLPSTRPKQSSVAARGEGTVVAGAQVGHTLLTCSAHFTLSVSPFLPVSVSLSVCLSLLLSLSISASASVSISLSLSPLLHLCLPLSLSISVSRSLSPSCLSASLSFSEKQPWSPVELLIASPRYLSVGP